MSLIRPVYTAHISDEAHRDLCRDFIQTIRERNGINLIPFDLDLWAKGAGSNLIQSTRHAEFKICPFQTRL